MPRGRKAGWSERGESGGRKKVATEEKTPFKHLSIYCSVEEVEQIKAIAKAKNKPVGRLLVESVLQNK